MKNKPVANEIQNLVTNKSWSVGESVKTRLISLIEQLSLNYFDGDLDVIEVNLLPGYFTTSVFKLTCQLPKTETHFYIKLAYFPKQLEKRLRQRIQYEYDCSLQIYQKFENSKDFETVKPIAYFPDEAGFVMQEMHGVRLDILMKNAMKLIGKENPEKLLFAMGEAGRWLAEFQRTMPTGGRVRFDKHELASRAEKFIEAVDKETSGLLSAELINQLNSKIATTLAEFTESDLDICMKHNDFAPWNVMMGEKGLIAFDFADVEYDSKFYDIYHFVRAINSFKLKPIKNSRIIEECKNSFLKGYGLSESSNQATQIFFNIYFAIERLQMLTRGRVRNVGLKGKLKNIYQKRHINWYLAELKALVE